jgi:uncharacterized protein YlzI (FlbEa/FlbD family)
MRKLLFLILLSIFMIGCSNDKSKVANDSSVSTSQTLHETQQTTVSTQSPSSEKNLEASYPKVLIPTTNEQINHAILSEGVFCIYNGKKYGFMNDSGNEIAPYIYEYAYPFSEGLACVRLDGKYGFIDDTGKVVIPVVYDKACPFSEGLAYFETGDQYGFLDINGEIAFSFACDSVSSFKEGLAYFSEGGKYGYINQTGEVVIKPAYDDAGYFQNGLAKVRLGFKIGVIDKNGTEIVPMDYEDISYDNGFIIAGWNGKYSCYDKAGNQIFEPVYNSITILPDADSAIVYLGDQPQIIDFKGNIKVSAKYDSMAYYGSKHDDGRIEVRLNGKVGFLDLSDLSEAVPTIYDWTSLFKNGHAVVGKESKYGVIDKKGNIVVPLDYDNIEIFNNGNLALSQGDEYVLADGNGKIINTRKYESIEQIGSCYIVGIAGKYGILDESGAEVIAPAYNYISTSEYNSVYNSKNSFVATDYDLKSGNRIIVAGEDIDTDLSRLLLQNVITPKIKAFSQYQEAGSIKVSSTDDNTMSVSIADGMKDCYKEFKLYDIDGNGKPVLDFYAEPLIRQGPEILSYSGIYSEKNGSLNELVTGYECGGTLGGDTVSLFKDSETSRILIGAVSHAGGFMGNASGCRIYEYQNGETTGIVSYEIIAQKAENHDESDLVKNAALYYDENGSPHNKDTILNADYITEYWRNNKQVTIEDYNRYADRYEVLPDFLYWLQW